MNWRIFQTYNKWEPHAFEAMCDQLFELWINIIYKEFLHSFVDAYWENEGAFA